MNTTSPGGPSVFGAVHLGYLVIETNRLTDWRRFGTDAIGMHHDALGPDLTRFRLDERECRFLLRRGPAEDVVATGWHIDDHATFDRMAARLRAHGVPATEGTAEEAALRGVERLLRFPGPKCIAQEIYTTPVMSAEPLRMLASDFVTGDSGMGHIALTPTRPRHVRGYFATVFDARLTDYADETISASANSASIWPLRLPAHQRQGAVLLRAHPLGLRVGGGLESPRHRRDDLGAHLLPEHQRLGPHTGRPDHRGHARPVPDGGPFARPPRGRQVQVFPLSVKAPGALVVPVWLAW